METREIEFAKLRHAYVTVKSFLESQHHGKVNSLNTQLANDLGMAGDDNLEFLEKFVEKFELDHKNYDHFEHFHSEMELFGPEAALLNLLTLSVWLPLKTIELLTLNKIKIETPNFNVQNREVSDLTFRELLTWYIEKEYKANSEIKYKIK